LALTCWLLLVPSALHAESWTDADAAVKATETDIAKGGIQAIRDHVESLEKALAEGAKFFPPPPSADGNTIILADGQLETLAVLLRAAATKQNAKAVFNPYPGAAFYLALYYNEVHQSDDALRAIDAGMKLSTPDGLTLGAHMPALYSEQAAAFDALKRYQEAFDVCDKGLKLASAGKMDRARMYRCRGFALTELNQLEEAKNSYEESLVLEPENPLAKRELGYIAKLRAGGERAPGEQILPPRTPEPKDAPANANNPI
jgi:tetratricopeptide (TPR) repeat protein